MEKQYISGSIIKGKDGGMDFIASDETKDRHGDIIPLDSWDLKNFIKAPRMLVDHWYSVANIVGKWADVRIVKDGDTKGLLMRAIFHNITELSKETRQMVEKGFLNTVSVGFIPHMDHVTDDDGEERDVARNELIEVSLVTVPANPNAEQIKSLAEKKLPEETQEKINDFVGSTEKTVKVEVNKEDKADEVTKIKINSKETRKDTPKIKGKSEGRRLSKKDKKLAIARQALKESAKHINFALNSLNK